MMTGKANYIGLIIAALLTGLFLTGCRVGIPDEGIVEPAKKRVGFSQADPVTPWKTAQLNSFIEAAADNQMELLYQEPEAYTTEWQIQNIRNLMDSQLDYLVIIPKEAEGFEDVLAEAAAKNIPVIMAEREAESEAGCVSSIAADYYREGQICARILAGSFAGKAGHILVIQGSEGSSVARDRLEGFLAEIEQYSQLEIVKTVPGNSNRLTAQKAVEKVIAEQEVEFQAIFSVSDEDGLGALQALKLAGRKPGKDTVLISIEGVQDVLKAIIAEEYLATIESNPRLGFIAFDMIRQIERGYQPPKRVFVPYQVYDLSNAEELFEMAY